MRRLVEVYAEHSRILSLSISEEEKDRTVGLHITTGSAKTKEMGTCVQRAYHSDMPDSGLEIRERCENTICN